MVSPDFIVAHENDDLAALVLHRDRWPDVDVALAAECIAARRKLRLKVPEWYADPALVCPVALSAEQCSSTATAAHKAMVAATVWNVRMPAEGQCPDKAPLAGRCRALCPSRMESGADGCSDAVLRTFFIGTLVSRDVRNARIDARLKARLEEGMIDEIRCLLEHGVPAKTLIGYGLEYKFVTLYMQAALTEDELFTKLSTAIHQFAKRQMTWFRGMERRGIKIEWIPFEWPMDKKVDRIVELMEK